MKSILLSIKPQWLAKILNGEKTIEVRKKFPKDYVGWVYLYCTKEDSLCCIKRIDRDRYICGKDFDLRDFPHLSSGYDGKGKVVARFWCDKVEEIVCHNMLFNEPTYNTELLFERQLCIKSCLGVYDLFDYLGIKNGFAIHISTLEIFDKPRKLSEFWTENKAKHCSKTGCPYFGTEKCQYASECNIQFRITKAPQNYCYIEGGIEYE